MRVACGVRRVGPGAGRRAPAAPREPHADTGHGRRSSGRCSPSSAARATGSPSARRRGCSRSRARRACSARRSTCPPAATSTRSRSTTPGTRTTAPVGRPAARTSPITAPGGPVTFTYDHATHVISDDTPRALGSRARRALAAPRRDRLAAAGRGADATGCTTPPRAASRSRAARSPAASSVPLTLDPAGLPADVRAQFPHLASYAALRALVRRARARAELLTGELVVAAYDGGGALLQQHRRADPRRARRPLRAGARARASSGPMWQPRPRRRSPCGRRRPRTSTLLARRAERRRRCAAATTACGARRGDASWRNAAYLLRGHASTCPTLDKVVTNVVTDPYSVALTHELRALGAGRPRRPGAGAARLGAAAQAARCASPRTRRSTSCTCATSRSPTRPSRPRIAAPTSRSPTAAATACATCATSRGPA